MYHVGVSYVIWRLNEIHTSRTLEWYTANAFIKSSKFNDSLRYFLAENFADSQQISSADDDWEAPRHTHTPYSLAQWTNQDDLHASPLHRIQTMMFIVFRFSANIEKKNSFLHSQLRCMRQTPAADTLQLHSFISPPLFHLFYMRRWRETERKREGER